MKGFLLSNRETSHRSDQQKVSRGFPNEDIFNSCKQEPSCQRKEQAFSQFQRWYDSLETFQIDKKARKTLNKDKNKVPPKRKELPALESPNNLLWKTWSFSHQKEINQRLLSRQIHRFYEKHPMLKL